MLLTVSVLLTLQKPWGLEPDRSPAAYGDDDEIDAGWVTPVSSENFEIAVDSSAHRQRTGRDGDRPLDAQVRAAGKPTLVILGGRDHFYGARSAARYEAAGARVEILPESGHSPLVDQLSRPASTPAHDVDLIVTESGHADLRGADWTQRRRLITKLFE